MHFWSSDCFLVHKTWPQHIQHALNDPTTGVVVTIEAKNALQRRREAMALCVLLCVKQKAELDNAETDGRSNRHYHIPVRSKPFMRALQNGTSMRVMPPMFSRPFVLVLVLACPLHFGK
jgi:hypothetical protein